MVHFRFCELNVADGEGRSFSLGKRRASSYNYVHLAAHLENLAARPRMHFVCASRKDLCICRLVALAFAHLKCARMFTCLPRISCGQHCDEALLIVAVICVAYRLQDALAPVVNSMVNGVYCHLTCLRCFYFGACKRRLVA